PPAVYHDLVITGAAVPEYPSKGPSGDVRAFDVRSGKLVWTFHTIPRQGEMGHESWEEDAWKERTGVNVWSMMSVDTKRGLIFLRSEEHTSELQSRGHLVCRLLLEKKKKTYNLK